MRFRLSSIPPVIMLISSMLVALPAGAAVPATVATTPSNIAAPAAPTPAGHALYSWGAGPGLGANGGGRDLPVPGPVMTAAGPLMGKTITAATANYNNSCVVASGRPYCLGAISGIGSVMPGPNIYVDTPVQVDTGGVLAGLTTTAVAMGMNHTCVIADSHVYCWGSDEYGQLGDGRHGPDIAAVRPVKVAGGALGDQPVRAIVAGDHHTCVLAANRMYCWGRNRAGELGDGTTTNSDVPVAVNLSGALRGLTLTSIGASFHITCVLASGWVYCWGNGPTQPNGLNEPSRTDPAPMNHRGVTAGLSAVMFAAGGPMCFVASDGNPYCWGITGVEPTALPGWQPAAHPPITAIVAGQAHTCMLAGSVYCWGHNESGQLGRGYLSAEGDAGEPYMGGALYKHTLVGIGAGGEKTFVITAEQPGFTTAPGTFESVGPTRIVDTRTGLGAPKTPMTPNGTLRVRVGGIAGVPARVSAVLVNVTVTGETRAGYLVVSRTPSPHPTTSTLNFAAQQTVSNTVVSALAPDGTLAIRNISGGSTQVLVDVLGYYLAGIPDSPGTFNVVAPARLLDTRLTRPIAPRQRITVHVAGRAGVGTRLVGSVLVTITVVGSVNGELLPNAGWWGPEIPFPAHRPVAETTTLGVSGRGDLTVLNDSVGPAHVIIDVLGYYYGGIPTAAGAFVKNSQDIPVTASGPLPGPIQPFGVVPMFADTSTIAASAKYGIYKALWVDLVVTNPRASGFLAVRAISDPTSRTSTVTFSKGQSISHGTVARISDVLVNQSPGATAFAPLSAGYFHI